MRVEDSLGYWLVTATRYFAAALDERLEAHCVERGKPYVINPAQWGVILELSTRDGHTIGTLAQRLGVDGPAITNLVKRLEQSGLVRRTRSREDERVVEVSLTPEGRDLHHSLDPLVEAFQDKLLPADQQRQLIDHLQHLIAGVSVVAPDAGERFHSLRAYVRGRVRERGATPGGPKGGSTHLEEKNE